MATIVVIDDERVILEGCRMSLADDGHEATCFTSGREGLASVAEGDADVVITDLKIPDINGMEILASLQEQQPDIPVIVMTGYSTVKNAVQAMKKGAFDYLAKPFTDEELLVAVHKAVQHRRLREENSILRKQLYQRFDFSNIVGESPAVLKIFESIEKVAPTNSTVLLTGESGTGKELFAGAVHAHSGRAAKQLVTLDCSTLSPSLLESELFGHVKGAFTGASQNKLGIFGTADNGSLFLDEVSNLSMEIQGKLLRVMEYGQYKPVGASVARKCDVRIIAATNKDLSEMVAKGEFREDLYYRLNVFPLRLPPLRERKEDIPRLAYHFLRSFCKKAGKQIDGFTDDALSSLINQPWPGNIRQLKNTVERLVIMADDECLDRNVLQSLMVSEPSRSGKIPTSLEELKAVKKDLLENKFGRIERAFLVKALDESDGNITGAAKNVGMQRSNFSSLMKKHNLSARD